MDDIRNKDDHTGYQYIMHKTAEGAANGYLFKENDYGVRSVIEQIYVCPEGYKEVVKHPFGESGNDPYSIKIEKDY